MNFEQQIMRLTFLPGSKFKFQAGYRQALLDAKKIAQKADKQTLILIDALIGVFPKGWQEEVHQKQCNYAVYIHDCNDCKSFLRRKISDGVRQEVEDLESFIFKNIE